jgi:hypothetical protein
MMMAASAARSPTLSDLMILVAAAALGAWGAAPYRAGIPIPITAHPELPLLPVWLSVPPTAALTWALIVVPIRTFRARFRHGIDEPGTVLCVGAAAGTLGVLSRWLLRVWFRPFRDGSAFIYGAYLLYDTASWCGLGIVAALALLALGGQLRCRGGWVEALRWGLALYWVTMFLIFTFV